MITAGTLDRTHSPIQDAAENDDHITSVHFECAIAVLHHGKHGTDVEWQSGPQYAWRRARRPK